MGPFGQSRVALQLLQSTKCFVLFLTGSLLTDNANGLNSGKQSSSTFPCTTYTVIHFNVKILLGVMTFAFFHNSVLFLFLFFLGWKFT
jgi:hypothetical protein